MSEVEERLRAYFANAPHDVAARDRLRSAITTTPPARNDRRAIAAAAAVVLVLAAVVAIVTTRATHNVAPIDHGTLTEQEFDVAVRLAREQADAKRTLAVSIATATATDGVLTDSNTGHPCTSGRLLHITVIGDFAIVTTGLPVRAGSTPDPGEFTVHAVVLTADPATGQTCLLGVRTGDVRPDPDATVLFRG